MREFNPEARRRHSPPVRGPGRYGRRGRRIKTLIRGGGLGAAVIMVLLGWAIVARSFAPMANSGRQAFDAIIVLGTPADSDGNPTPAMLDRVTEGVREYQRGIAPRLIVTGGSAHNDSVEARVMAKVAQAQGVPAAVVFVEPEALDTIQNACYSTRIMKAHGWHSAEVVSARSHLPRAAMIFGNLPIQWRMHAAPETLSSVSYSRAAEVVETIKTVRYLVWARWTEDCTP